MDSKRLQHPSRKQGNPFPPSPLFSHPEGTPPPPRHSPRERSQLSAGAPPAAPGGAAETLGGWKGCRDGRREGGREGGRCSAPSPQSRRQQRAHRRARGGGSPVPDLGASRYGPKNHPQPRGTAGEKEGRGIHFLLEGEPDCSPLPTSAQFSPGGILTTTSLSFLNANKKKKRFCVAVFYGAFQESCWVEKVQDTKSF